MEFDKKIIGKRIKYYRERAGYSQTDFANLLGIKNNALSQYESGDRSIDDNIKFAICAALQIEPNELFAYQPSKKGIKIPVLGRVVAGIPIEAITEILDYEEITENLAATGDFFALVAKGDSMNPTIIDGDVLIIRKQDTVDDGQVGIVLIDGMDATVKRIHITAGGITLIGDNPAVFPPHFYTNDEIDTLPVKIIGKVVEIRRKMI